MRGTLTSLDERDAAIVAERMATLDAIAGPRVGDFVRFADGVTRRISHLWGDDPQTSDAGSYHLGDGYVSMSGGLYPSVPGSTLTLTEETRDGSVWIFHHNYAGAGRGVDTLATFRVYVSSVDAPR